jgi:hypothetical protein
VVEPERVVRVVAPLDRDQPPVVGAPEAAREPSVVGRQVVQVLPVRQMWVECLEGLLGPGDAGVGVTGVLPLRHDEQAVAGAWWAKAVAAASTRATAPRYPDRHEFRVCTERGERLDSHQVIDFALDAIARATTTASA